MESYLNTDATLALQIDRLMRRFHSVMHPRAQNVDMEKVGPIGGMILLFISEHQPTTAQMTAASLGRDKSQVSRVISLLDQKGLIEKTTSSEDARQVDLYLSEKGRMQVAAFNGVMVETTREILGELSREEAEQFSDLLSKILAGSRLDNS